jgi:hypothetical protein
MDFNPGYTISKDRYGNLVDTDASLTERFCIIGYAWRIDTGYVTLAADAAYTLINFKTPATGRCFYNFSTVDKSGAEVVAALIRGGTVAGSPVAATAYNYNEEIADASCPLTSVSVGGTVTGGTERFTSLVPGDANPSSKPGGASRQQGLIILKQNTVYSLKLLAKGGAVTLAANIGVGYVPSAD